ncbi:DNA-dependent RNA polymerase subunit epsilon [Eremococcus coleocola]|uniref:DNA-dependent RNA polymerase subunit epsilon n=1 Tax=Eremococcus coleocola TaxID=88132 RepID=UPI000419C873|nr:DNA-directed RNA polymerase subunit epsilon [Eremococcus coleocola]
MIYKVNYQENKIEVPRRENTKALYVEADSIVEARSKISENTPYNIEFIQEIDGAFLEYEQENNPDFKVLTF